MKQENDYTINARKYAFKYPIFTSISTQINFWILAYMVLSGVIYNFSMFINSGYENDIPYAPVPAFLGSFIMACFFGTALGLSDHFLFKRWSSTMSLGLLIMIKGLFYLLIMTLMFAFMRYVIWEFIIHRYFFSDVKNFDIETAWPYMVRIYGLYTLAMGLVISFIIQVNKKFGPGILIPLLLGKYLSPRKEERIFMFLDLASSTAIAEKLGHIKYSELIRDCFLEINKATIKYQAEIYQYVGDEMVLTWLNRDQLDRLICIEFFYESINRLKRKEPYFIEKYGVFPSFKAGMHEGWVTGVEVGNVKRDVAYHGDTLNVASRIQKKCKEYNCDLLISEGMEKNIKWNESYTLKEYKAVQLQGRKDDLSLFCIKQVEVL